MATTPLVSMRRRSAWVEGIVLKGPGRAQEHLTTATAMYRDMDMRFWLKKAEAELGVR